MANRPSWLCEKCATLDLVQAREHEGYLHHSCFGAIRRSAASGCDLCKLIVEATQFRTKYDSYQADWENEETEETRIKCHLYSCSALTEEEGIFSSNVPHSELSISEKSYPFPGRFSSSLRVFVDHDASASIRSLISGRPIEPRANSDFCYSLARTWLDRCLQNHAPVCPSSSASEMPTRVIDIGHANSDIAPRLYVTEGRRGSWVTLSHCWGREAHFVTNSNNIAQKQVSIPISELEPTFLDAIYVTRQLGQRYLWIDSLCIIQDSRSDWAQESTRMRDYYKHSLITISSDSASGDHEGFLAVARIQEISVLLGVQLPGEGTFEVQLTKENLSRKVEDMKTSVNCRAWTLQEDLLSPRTLHYTRGQMVWKCQSQACCEADAISLENYGNLKHHFLVPPAPDNPDAKPRYRRQMEHFTEPISRWYRIHRNYAKRSLTFVDDKLPAISGIAREIQRQTGFTYKGGIWMEDISRGLLWDAFGAGKRPEQYRAPSWSWAALDINYDTIDRSGLEPTYSSILYEQAEEAKHRRVQVVACEVISRDGDQYGCVESGYMQLSGRILPIAKWTTKLPYFSAYWKPEGAKTLHFLQNYSEDEAHSRDELVLHFDLFPSGSDESSVNFENVSMLQISTWDWTGFKQDTNLVTVALLLEPADDLGNFRRVGIAEVPNYNGLADEGWEIADVTII